MSHDASGEEKCSFTIRPAESSASGSDRCERSDSCVWLWSLWSSWRWEAALPACRLGHRGSSELAVLPFPEAGQCFALPGMTATEGVGAAGNCPLGRSRRLASWDPRDRDKQIGGRPCRWELGADCIQVSVGHACVVGWRCCTLGVLPLESRLLITLDHVGFSTQVLLEFSGVLSVLCLVMCLDLSTYVIPSIDTAKRSRNQRLSESCFRDSWWFPEEFLVRRADWGEGQ